MPGWYTQTEMPQLVDSVVAQLQQLSETIFDQVRLTTLLDVGITAILIYWLFSLIRGTRAVRLVLGVSFLFALYALAQWFDLRMVSADPADGRRRRASSRSSSSSSRSFAVASNASVASDPSRG